MSRCVRATETQFIRISDLRTLRHMQEMIHHLQVSQRDRRAMYRIIRKNIERLEPLV